MAKVKTEKTTNVTFAKGGNNPMMPPQAAEPAEKGETSDTSMKDSAPGPKFAAGGSNKMYGFAPSATATAGKSSAR